MTLYCFSFDGESFRGQEPADSHEQAAAAAAAHLEPGQRFFVGEVCPVVPEHYLSAEHLLEDVSERMYDDVGDVADPWPDADGADIARLQESLRRVFRDWLAETGNLPTFYEVANVKPFTAPSEVPS